MFCCCFMLLALMSTCTPYVNIFSFFFLFKQMLSCSLLFGQRLHQLQNAFFVAVTVLMTSCCLSVNLRHHIPSLTAVKGQNFFYLFHLPMPKFHNRAASSGKEQEVLSAFYCLKCDIYLSENRSTLLKLLIKL